MAKFKILFGWVGGKLTPPPPPYKHDISLLNLAVLLTLRLLSSSIDRFYPYWSMSKVEKTVERAIHPRSTRYANFDKYKKYLTREITYWSCWQWDGDRNWLGVPQGLVLRYFSFKFKLKFCPRTNFGIIYCFVGKITYCFLKMTKF